MSEQQFKNENLTVNVTKNPGCQAELDISVTPKASMAAYMKAIKNVNKQVSIPGFRKGKAPNNLIIDQFKKHVDQEWREILIQTAFQESLKLTSTYPMNQESIKRPDVKRISKEEGSEIKISFETAPDVPSVEIDKIKLKKEKRKEIKPKDIEESLEEIRLMHAEWNEIKDRKVKEGDFVDLDIENLDIPGQYLCKDARFEVKKDKMGDWMRKLIIGLKPTENVDGVSERSKDMDKEAEFKPTNCKITVKTIKEPVLPELNDELAKKVGLESVENLKKRVEQNLNNQADEEVKDKLRKQVEAELLKKYPFDLPASMMEAEIKNRLQTQAAGLGKANLPEDELKKRLEEVRLKIHDDVEKAFRLFYISRKIAQDNGINISKDEMIKETIQEMYMNPAAAHQEDPDEARARVYVRLISRKAKDFLIDKAMPQEVE